MTHEPIMVEEILTAFALQPGGVVVDATLGLGGHALHFCNAISPGGTLVGFDWDEAMLEEAKSRLVETTCTKYYFHSDYRAIKSRMNELGLKATGILMDLGLNSAQIDDPTRGFSFKESGPLDMRMNRAMGEPASAILNRMTLSQLDDMLFSLGDERWARAIARAIVERRKDKPLRNTDDLIECVLAAVPVGARDKRIHPATRSMQAIRIFVNGELDGLSDAISDAATCLAPNGVLAVLSFHSGEDRLVKQAYKNLNGNGFCHMNKKPAAPSEDEVRRNPRSRSAKLRLLQRTAGS